MEVYDLIFCQDTFQLPEVEDVKPKNLILEATAAFHLQYIPSNFSFGAVIMFLGPFDAANNVEFFLVYPDGTSMQQFGIQISPEFLLQNGLGEDTINLNLNIKLSNVDIRVPGAYKGKIFFDGVEKYSRDVIFTKK